MAPSVKDSPGDEERSQPEPAGCQVWAIRRFTGPGVRVGPGHSATVLLDHFRCASVAALNAILNLDLGQEAERMVRTEIRNALG